MNRFAKIADAIAFDARCSHKSASHAQRFVSLAQSASDPAQRASYEASARFMQTCAANSAKSALAARTNLI